MMTGRIAATGFAALAGLALLAGAAATPVAAQRMTPADLAAAISGTWTMNIELSPQFRPPAQRQGSAGPLAPAFGTSRSAPALALQRGGRGGGGAPAAPPDPRQMAGQAALRGLQQVADTMTIAATADSVTFTDPRGSRTYAIDNKTHRVDVGEGAEITQKSRWDGRSLRQEFIYDETKVSHTYELNREGNRIEFTMRIDNFSGGVGRQAKGVYDKQAAQ